MSTQYGTTGGAATLYRQLMTAIQMPADGYVATPDTDGRKKAKHARETGATAQSLGTMPALKRAKDESGHSVEQSLKSIDVLAVKKRKKRSRTTSETA
jgi:hypothetical protein